MTLCEGIQKLQKLIPFVGGNDRQRAHLNAIIDRINAMIDAANQDPNAAGAAGAQGTLLMTILANGTPVDVIFTAYVSQ